MYACMFQTYWNIKGHGLFGSKLNVGKLCWLPVVKPFLCYRNKQVQVLIYNNIIWYFRLINNYVIDWIGTVNIKLADI